MSDTNFCAARESSLFLFVEMDKRFTEACKWNSQPDVLTFKPYALQIVVRDLIRDLFRWTSASLQTKGLSVQMCFLREPQQLVRTYQGFVIV